MSENTKYSVSAMSERYARCKAAMDREKSEYLDSIKAWILSCCRRFNDMEEDISSALVLVDNMRSMGLAEAMGRAGLAYDEITSGFHSGPRLTYKRKAALHVRGFEIDLLGDGKVPRLLGCHMGLLENKSMILGYIADIVASPEKYDLDAYALRLVQEDSYISGSKVRMASYMASVDKDIDELPAFIQRLCEFADKNIGNK